MTDRASVSRSRRDSRWRLPSCAVNVLAVEIRQYVGAGEQMLVPRVFGQTAETRQKKSRPSRQWDEPSFREEMERACGKVAADVSRQIIAWSREHFTRLAWGRGLT